MRRVALMHWFSCFGPPTFSACSRHPVKTGARCAVGDCPLSYPSSCRPRGGGRKREGTSPRVASVAIPVRSVPSGSNGFRCYVADFRADHLARGGPIVAKARKIGGSHRSHARVSERCRTSCLNSATTSGAGRLPLDTVERLAPVRSEDIVRDIPSTRLNADSTEEAGVSSAPSAQNVSMLKQASSRTRATGHWLCAQPHAIANRAAH